MSNSKSKTEGLEWLLLSLASFNGSGYADMRSPEDFLESYVAYKTLKKKKEAVQLANLYKPEALTMLKDLLGKTLGASRTPPEKYLKRVEAQRKSINDQIGLLW